MVALRYVAKHRRVLFARVGWMKFYAGPQHGDEKPVGGGSYNIDDKGHEMFNFADVKGKLYGYVQPSRGASGPNLARIKRAFAGGQLVDVTVVWVAKKVVVGWYCGATIYAESQHPSGSLATRRQGCMYNCEAETGRSVLLPTRARTLVVPHGAAGMGQANTTYALDQQGNALGLPWIQDTLDWIDSYSGFNLLDNPDIEVQDEAGVLAEETRAAARGQGFVGGLEARAAVEKHAVQEAKRFFEGDGYSVKEVGRPYDLRCTRGNKTVFVEVKGTQGDGQDVILTPGEVEFARQHPHSIILFVMHSISITKRHGVVTASAGVRRILHPWILNKEHLKPITYWYTVPSGHGGV